MHRLYSWAELFGTEYFLIFILAFSKPENGKTHLWNCVLYNQIIILNTPIIGNNHTYLHVPGVPIHSLDCVDSKMLSQIIMEFFSDATATTFRYFRIGNSLLEPDFYEYHSLKPCHGNSQVNSSKVHKDDISYNDGKLRLCILSDTHDRHYLFENIPPSDILIHAGDIFMTNRMISTNRSVSELEKFNDWIGKQDAKHKIVIGGNHDLVLETLGKDRSQSILSNAIYLCNSGIELFGLKIFGTPLSRGHSANRAFQSTEFLHDTMQSISEFQSLGGPIDIFISHGPNGWLGQEIQPTVMHIYGHIHASHGVHCRKSKDVARDNYWYEVGAPIMDRRYNPSQLPLIVDIARPSGTNSTRGDDSMIIEDSW